MFDLISKCDARLAGLKEFFTGVPCTKGHLATRRVVDGRCTDCDKLRKAAFRKNNAQNISEYQKAYGKTKSADISVQKRAYYEENTEKILEQKAIYRKGNAAKRAKYNEAYHAKNPDAWRRQSSIRRAQKLRASLGWDAELTKLVIDEAFALAVAREDITGTTWEVDHMIPLCAVGVCGFHTWNNLQVIPAVLNRRKGNSLIFTLPGEWISSLS